MDASRRPPDPEDRPGHPTLAAGLLMAGVVVLIVVVSLIGTLGAS